MALDNLLSIFKPRDRVFFFHFEASAANVLRMSEDLRSIMATEPGSQRVALLERLEIAEHANDDLTHTIFTDLARNSSPRSIAGHPCAGTSLDDVADFILAAAKNLELFGIKKPDETCRELARLVHEAARSCNWRAGPPHHGEDRWQQRVRQCASTVWRTRRTRSSTGPSSVFSPPRPTDPVDPHARHVPTLELATDKCEDVGNVIESIMLKYA
ncbi:MAG: hypothetical protein H6590_08155 [Flavobacteriales bacterium]|nr:hypothetical protein [Flavobacteriales bacterium]